MLAEFGALSREDVARAAGLGEACDVAGHWERQGRLASVDVDGVRRYPRFQFGENAQPLPAIARVLAALEPLGPWQTVLWFVTASGWLGDRRPVDLLKDEPEAVVAAAEKLLRQPIA